MYNSTLYLNRVTFQYNGSYGLWIDGSSNAQFSPNGTRAGYNTVSGSGCWVYNGASQMVYADYTYWDNPPTCSPPSSKFSGSVTRSFPQGCGGASAIAGLSRPGVKEIDPQTLGSSDPSDSAEALTLIRYLVSLLQNYPDSASGAVSILSSFIGPTGTYQTALNMPWKSYLSTLAQWSASFSVKVQAFEYLLRALVIERHFDAAIALADSVSTPQIFLETLDFLIGRLYIFSSPHGSTSEQDRAMVEASTPPSTRKASLRQILPYVVIVFLLVDVGLLTIQNRSLKRTLSGIPIRCCR